jgi:hypothetical protein
MTKPWLTDSRDRASRKYILRHAALKAEVEAMRKEDGVVPKRERHRLASQEHRSGRG